MRAILLCLALQLAAPIAAVQMNSFDNLALPAVTEVASLSMGAIQDAPPPSDPSTPPSNPPADNPSTDVNIAVEHDDGGTLGVSPVWLAIGGLGLLVLISLIVMAVRNKGGETTVVRQ